MMLAAEGTLAPGVNPPPWKEFVNSLADKSVKPEYFDRWQSVAIDLRRTFAHEAVDAIYQVRLAISCQKFARSHKASFSNFKPLFRAPREAPL